MLASGIQSDSLRAAPPPITDSNRPRRLQRKGEIRTRSRIHTISHTSTNTATLRRFLRSSHASALGKRKQADVKLEMMSFGIEAATTSERTNFIARSLKPQWLSQLHRPRMLPRAAARYSSDHVTDDPMALWTILQAEWLGQRDHFRKPSNRVAPYSELTLSNRSQATGRNVRSISRRDASRAFPHRKNLRLRSPSRSIEAIAERPANCGL